MEEWFGHSPCQYQRLEASESAKHHAGAVNSISVDFELHRFMLCGAGDASLSLWDLEGDCNSITEGQPVATIPRNDAHKFGVSKVMWWPNDNGMFFSGSYDGTIKLWDADSLEPVYTFNMEQKVYNFDVPLLDMSGLIAAGLDHPYIRLIDIRSGSSSHILKGHNGKVMTVKWCPTNSQILASGGSDGTVRIWDIRRAESWVMSLDMFRTSMHDLAPLSFRKAHRGPVNGLCWMHMGDELISLGNDSKARFWDLTVSGGENKSINIGPLFHNRHLQALDPVLSPPGELDVDSLFVSSDSGCLLVVRTFDGKVIAKLDSPEPATHSRMVSYTLRGLRFFEMYSGSSSGTIYKWTLPVA